MKTVYVQTARPVKIFMNGAVKGDKWGQIVCVNTGRVLHTGQLQYIRRIAVGKYNALMLK